jgi:hypothetical protein
VATKQKRNICYPDPVPPRVCVVTITDSRGIKHSVEVTAESLFEAGVLAIGTLRKAGWIEESPGPGTRLEIEVREPSVTHTVTIQQLHRWVSGATKSPAERLKREQMRVLLVHSADTVTQP